MMIIDEQLATFDPETGCLELDLSPWCQTKLRFHPWDEGLALERWEDGQWWPEPEDPGISLFDSGLRSSAVGPIRNFLALIPPEVMDLALPFDHCQTIVLRMLGISAPVRALAASSPILMALVAEELDRGSLTERQARALLGGSKVEILAAVTGIESEEAVRVLERLRLNALDQETLGLVRRALALPYTLHLLRFHREITASGLRFAVSQSPASRLRPSSREVVPGVRLPRESAPVELKHAC